jgi:hypothetical protein
VLRNAIDSGLNITSFWLDLLLPENSPNISFELCNFFGTEIHAARKKAERAIYLSRIVMKEIEQ